MAERMRGDFASREELEGYVRERFGQHASAGERLAALRGAAALPFALDEVVDTRRYAKTRNHVEGEVTRLSPWIRHGVVTLAEVRDAALAQGGGGAGKLVSELGWRDFYQRVLDKVGHGVWQDREPYKTGLAPEDYADELPDFVPAAQTGLACMDGFARELHETGYLHNHARMWVAAYVVHWLRVKWQAGARWFLNHLLDGDLASNNLSWQWVASTFAHKPYIFNRGNLSRYTDDAYCRVCPSAERCPFDAPYAELEARLFDEADRAA